MCGRAVIVGLRAEAAHVERDAKAQAAEDARMAQQEARGLVGVPAP